jgi:hypothetical protein
MTVGKTLTDRETEDLKEFFEERAGILEYDAGLPRPEAELEAARRSTLGTGVICGHPCRRRWRTTPPCPLRCLTGPARSIPNPSRHGRGPRARGRQARPRLGHYITEAEIEAARKSRTVVRQGPFTGAYDVAEARGSDA